jgi:hypothetical protein
MLTRDSARTARRRSLRDPRDRVRHRHVRKRDESFGDIWIVRAPGRRRPRVGPQRPNLDWLCMGSAAIVHTVASALHPARKTPPARDPVVALAIVRIGPDLTTAFVAERSSASRAGISPWLWWSTKSVPRLDVRLVSECAAESEPGSWALTGSFRCPSAARNTVSLAGLERHATLAGAGR